MANTAGASPPRFAIGIGSRRLTGWPAVAILTAALLLVGAVLVWIRPTFRMSLAAALWIGFVGYWAVAARQAAPTASAESAASRTIHRWLLNLSLALLFVPVPGLRVRWIPLAWPLVATGLVVQALGFLLAAWARRHLGRHWSGAVTVAVDHQLVRSGPYRVLRHPIYTAMFVMYLGICLVSGEAHALVGLAVLAVAYGRKIPLEERTLEQTFGSAYQDYRRTSWALIPGLL